MDKSEEIRELLNEKASNEASLRPLFLQKITMKGVAHLVKQHMNNFGLTYLGRLPFKE